ncbi:MAG: hypothetical protein JJ863_07580 [Deltaproteobacteria bacterium]|nr:hypothetical protein [Deltaproteobacteria bacterium]
MDNLMKHWIDLKIRIEELRKDKAGLSTVEYIIILILIAVVAIALWQQFGEAVTARIEEGTGAINGMPSGGGGS